MSKGPQRIKGTQDIWGEKADRFRSVLAAFERLRRVFAFDYVEVPVFEATKVFARSIGETTDIVSKEMYTFPDREGDSLTLRPEFTAGLCRAYLSEGWQQFAPLKVVTQGPVFRYESPQKGRFRQFHQLDAEIIGAESASADIELLVLADQLLNDLDIADSVRLELNTLGDAETRDNWRVALVRHFETHRSGLSEESLARLERNPLRILDSKDPQDHPIADLAPSIDDFLTPAAADFFAAVTRGLDGVGVSWTRNPRLVRGLDYYRHTAFEFVTDQLGSQGAVIAGGRYDGLIESLGGPSTPAVGWAAGIERLAMLIAEPPSEKPAVAVVPDKPHLEAEAFAVATILRRTGLFVEFAPRGNAKRRIESARKKEIEAVLIVRAETENPRLHLTQYGGSDEARGQLRERILHATRGHYTGLSGQES